jgi:hypothetical protein
MKDNCPVYLPKFEQNAFFGSRWLHSAPATSVPAKAIQRGSGGVKLSACPATSTDIKAACWLTPVIEKRIFKAE